LAKQNKAAAEKSKKKTQKKFKKAYKPLKFLWNTRLGRNLAPSFSGRHRCRVVCQTHLPAHRRVKAQRGGGKDKGRKGGASVLHTAYFKELLARQPWHINCRGCKAA